MRLARSLVMIASTPLLCTCIGSIRGRVGVGGSESSGHLLTARQSAAGRGAPSPLLRTLTTTSRPSTSVARWTEAIEAVASGVGSMWAKSSVVSCTSNSVWIVRSVVAHGSRGTASCAARTRHTRLREPQRARLPLSASRLALPPPPPSRSSAAAPRRPAPVARRACSTRSSSIHASGMMSALVERNWPT